MKSQDLAKDLKSQYSQEQLIKILKWVGTALFVLASTSMALLGHKYIDLQLYIYICYIFGAFFWLAVGILSKDKPQIVLYCVFAAVDITGIVTRLSS